MLLQPQKAKTAELEAELALYQEAGVDGVAQEFKNNAERAEEIERLQKEHGHPVLIDAAFIEANPVLAKLLVDNGAQEGEIVFAEQVDLDHAAELEAEAKRRDEIIAELATLGDVLTPEEGSTLTTVALEARLEHAKKDKDENTAPPPADPGAPEAPGHVPGEELVYNGKTVVRTNDRVMHGRSYKDVTLTDGTVHTLTDEEYARDVKPRD